MPQDSTFEFEKRRNEPVKYDRELVGTTLRAMKRLQQIQRRREERFYKARMAPHKERKKRADRVEIEKNLSLVAPAMAREKTVVNVKEALKLAQEARKKAGDMGAVGVRKGSGMAAPGMRGGAGGDGSGEADDDMME